MVGLFARLLRREADGAPCAGHAGGDARHRCGGCAVRRDRDGERGPGRSPHLALPHRRDRRVGGRGRRPSAASWKTAPGPAPLSRSRAACARGSPGRSITSSPSWRWRKAMNRPASGAAALPRLAGRGDGGARMNLRHRLHAALDRGLDLPQTHDVFLSRDRPAPARSVHAGRGADRGHRPPRARRDPDAAQPNAAQPSRPGRLSRRPDRSRASRRRRRRAARGRGGDRPAAARSTVIGTADLYRTVTGFAVDAGDRRRRRPTCRSHPAEAEVADVFEVPLAFLLDPANRACRHASTGKAARAAITRSSGTTAASGARPRR